MRSAGRLAVCLLLLSLPAILGAELSPRTDSDGIIRIIHIGKAWLYANYPASVWVKDPRLDWYPVPSHAWSMGEEAFRMLRLYLPRSEEILYNDFDVIVEDGMDASHLRPEFHVWMAKAIEEEGLGFIMADDSSSFATSGRHTSWYLYPIGDVLPVSDVAQIFREHHGYTVVPKPEFRDHPLLRSIPWNEIRIWAHNRPDPKPGSTVLAECSREIVWNRDKPVVVYWDTETGRSVAYVHKWHGTPNDPGGDIPGNEEFYRWKWHPDLIYNLIYWPARVPIPKDLVTVHTIRLQLNAFNYKRLYAVSAMEFADKFGANLRTAEEKMARLLERKEVADEAYLAAELDACLLDLESLLAEMDALTREVLAAREKAMLWIFLAEWLAVSATGMLAGFVVWTLMVRRRLYREVGVTRIYEI